jgi:hypothetical protein
VSAPLKPGLYSAKFSGVDAKGNPIIDLSSAVELDPKTGKAMSAPAPTPQTTRVEHEMSTGWGLANPELMVRSFVDFQQTYSVKEWCHTIDFSRDGFITLIAHRRK